MEELLDLKVYDEAHKVKEGAKRNLAAIYTFFPGQIVNVVFDVPSCTATLTTTTTLTEGRQYPQLFPEQHVVNEKVVNKSGHKTYVVGQTKSEPAMLTIDDRDEILKLWNYTHPKEKITTVKKFWLFVAHDELNVRLAEAKREKAAGVGDTGLVDQSGKPLDRADVGNIMQVVKDDVKD